MKDNSNGVCLVRLLLGLLAFTTACENSPNEEDGISIGVVAPFSGAARGFGQHIEECVDYAVKEINSAGGVLGKPLKQVPADSQSDSTLAQAVVKELHASGVSTIVGPASSSVLLAAVQYAEDNEMLLISPTATASEISNLGDSVWRTAPSDLFQAGLAAEIAIDNSWTTASIIYLENSYGQGLAQSFESAYEGLGGTILATGSFPELGPDDLDSYDFGPVLEPLLENEPELLYMVSYNLDGAAITWEIPNHVTAPYTPQLIGTEGTAIEEFVTNCNLTVSEGMLSTIFTVDKENPNYTKLDSGFADYVGMTGQMLPLCATVYDAVYLVAYAMQRGGAWDGKTVGDNLRAVSEGGKVINVGEWQKGVEALAAGADIDYEGASGSLTFDETGDIVEAFYEIREIIDGESAVNDVVKFGGM